MAMRRSRLCACLAALLTAALSSVKLVWQPNQTENVILYQDVAELVSLNTCIRMSLSVSAPF